MVDAEGRDLVFLLSTPRAGSTLVGSILGGHSRVLCPSEPWLLLPLWALRADSAAIAVPYDHALAREAWREWGDDDLCRRAAAAFAVTVYEALLRQAGRAVFVDKTPRYYHLLPWLDAVFPRAKKVWLRRNPLDVVASFKESWQIGVDETTGRVVSPHTFDTTVAFELLPAWFGAGAPSRYSLAYERLVEEPAREVEALCGFLGLDFEPEMVEYGASPDILRTLAAQRMGDKKILEHRRPHAASVGRWRDALTPGEIRAVLLTLGSGVFVRAGYGDLLEEAARQAGLPLPEIAERGGLEPLFAAYAGYGPREVEVSRRLAAELAESELERGRLRDRLDLLAAALEGVRESRTYRLLRRLGRWDWLERILIRERGSDA